MPNNALNNRSRNRPLRGLELNRCAGFDLCCERYVYQVSFWQSKEVQ